MWKQEMQSVFNNKETEFIRKSSKPLKKWAKERFGKEEKRSSRWENSMSGGQMWEYSLTVISSSHSSKATMAPNYLLNMIRSPNHRLQSFPSLALYTPANSLVRYIKWIYSTQNLCSPCYNFWISVASLKVLSLRHYKLFSLYLKNGLNSEMILPLGSH